VERKEAVGYLGSRGKGGSQDHMDREVQAYYRTGSFLRGDNGRPNISQSKQHTQAVCGHGPAADRLFGAGKA